MIYDIFMIINEEQVLRYESEYVVPAQTGWAGRR